MISWHLRSIYFIVKIIRKFIILSNKMFAVNSDNQFMFFLKSVLLLSLLIEIDGFQL